MIGAAVLAGTETRLKLEPETAIGVAAGEVDPEAAGGLADACADLEELQADGVEGGAFELGSGQVDAQFADELVGKGVKEESEPVGPEAVA